ncbi:FAD-dependent oxidoreductase [Actinomadura sp. 9N407]|uniref:FAD-dependent oxidoreductase n=1 Tax=Actinomadura sp. 9N407 TaxID=3375154 RepID=UPI00379A8830
MPATSASDGTVDEKYDVVVVGVGAAGSAAALAAHEAGARVLVVEKCDPGTAGGNTRVSGGGWFVHDDPSRAELFLRNLSEDFPLPDDVVEAWARETAGLSDWVRGLGADARANPDYHTGPEYDDVEGSDCYGGMETVEGRMGNFLLYDALLSALAERGIEVRFSEPAQRLLTDGDGNVTGLETPSGTIGARGGIVLATGGFEADPDMVANYLRVADHVTWGSPYATGDGHRMAQDVGADLWNMSNMMTIVGVPTGDGRGNLLALWHAQNYIFVNGEGRRFIDESSRNKHGHVLRNGYYEHFPLRPLYLVFDERVRTAGPIVPGPEALPVGWSTLMDGHAWSPDNSAEIDDGRIERAETVGGLAALLDMDPATLARTIDSYNTSVAQGRDDAFGRKPTTLAPVSQPPFYAVRCHPLLGWSNGGPRRNGRAQVLDTRGSVIEGLFAAGTVSSTYSSLKDGGFHIADAFAFGRGAARAAATRGRRPHRGLVACTPRASPGEANTPRVNVRATTWRRFVVVASGVPPFR